MASQHHRSFRPLSDRERAALERAKAEVAYFEKHGHLPEQKAEVASVLNTAPGEAQGRLELKVVP